MSIEATEWARAIVAAWDSNYSMLLKATDENHSDSWKKFNSSEVGWGFRT